MGILLRAGNLVREAWQNRPRYRQFAKLASKIPPSMRDIPVIHSFPAASNDGRVGPRRQGNKRMVSPYLRRRLRSLEEIGSEPLAEGRGLEAGGLSARLPAPADFRSEEPTPELQSP